MKTIVVLIALAGIASAAPASPQGNGFKIIASRSPSFIKRQKKSPQQQESFIPQSPESVSQFETLPDDFSADVNGPTASARSHSGFKGPIVVKKKSGYHYYRNSEEERAAADPHENCGKQMRVKLCNSHVNRRSNDMIAATNDNRNPKDDVELSMQVAEEALQSLQKNMQKMEENGQWKHGQSELDTTMHQNIEAVRQALQNVQGRIGKKETTNLQATTLKDTKLDHAGMKHGKFGKSSDVDIAMQESDQMDTLETAEKSAKENMLQWKHHDNARTSYGGYALGGLNLGGASGVHLAGAGGPAVGVFPHAKVGGCAIPLLLSCSPSVVQGSLAKSHSSYAAPAYKESDDLNSKKKRDAVKTSKDLTSSKMKMPTKKNTEILETML
ncbi:unnamed protein product [Chilo suppressalis]|uniref:Uncharacterized protein n=1 Tax=Chilo suppressalis TaxID=168631 RepID=A0ABN8BC94_CHISP|nr:unnamed protein product [Chilo suppressalis]